MTWKPAPIALCGACSGGCCRSTGQTALIRAMSRFLRIGSDGYEVPAIGLNTSPYLHTSRVVPRRMCLTGLGVSVSPRRCDGPLTLLAWDDSSG